MMIVTLVVVALVFALLVGCVAGLIGIALAAFGVDPTTGQLIAMAALFLLAKSGGKVEKS